jgi:hypothetical protein
MQTRKKKGTALSSLFWNARAEQNWLQGGDLLMQNDRLQAAVVLTGENGSFPMALTSSE